MRKTLVVLVAAMMVGMTIPAFAELQNVQVGGSLRIRGNWYSANNLGFDDDASGTVDALYVEQRTRINVSADFTDDVHTFIELDSYNVWGDSFRGFSSPSFSDDDIPPFPEAIAAANGIYVPGEGDVDGVGGVFFGTSDGFAAGDSLSSGVNLYQAYVEMRESWGYPITVRIGRSEMVHGDEFLVGNNDASSGFSGLSFDGAWLTYDNESFDITAFWTRLFQDNPFSALESSGDTDFAGIYGSYTGLENMTIDGYYYFFHQSLTSALSAVGFDEASEFHTVGARFAGNMSQFDWALNGAYQFGDSGFDDVDMSAFGVQGALGYTFDVNMQPRIFINGGYYSGADSDVFEDGDGDLGFNRLFSDHEYSEFLDEGNLSNIWFVGGGVGAQVTEAIGLTGVVNWFNAVEEYEDEGVGGDETSIGFEVGIYAKYDYSEDLYFQAGYAHFFAGDAVEDGVLVLNQGLGAIGGNDEKDDLDYVFIETGISF